jgi:prepilin-type N-terminal cleavage/methylation domain-containing protein
MTNRICCFQTAGSKLLNPRSRKRQSGGNSALVDGRGKGRRLLKTSGIARSPRGFSLVEVLITVSLLGVFMLLAYRLLGATFEFQVATREANNHTARLDDAIRRLRDDVITSKSIVSPNDSAVNIVGPQSIEWRFNQGRLTRKFADHVNSWELNQPVHFKLDGSVLLVAVDSDQPIAMGRLP